MRDDFTRRAAFTSTLDETTADARVFRLVRFRGQTVANLLGGIAGGIGGAVLDGLFGGDDAGDSGEAVDRRPPGLAVIALGERGEPIGRFAFHPIEDDLEAFVTCEVVRAARRLGAAVELFAERTGLERWEPSELGGAPRVGLRENAATPLAPFEGLELEATRQGDGVRLVHERRTPPSLLFAVLGIGLGIVFWWAALLLLLFRDGRHFVRGILRSAFRGHVHRWEATLSPTQLEVRIRDDDEESVAQVLRHDIVLVSWAPDGWTHGEVMGTDGQLRRHAFRVLGADGFRELRLPSRVGRELGPALRRVLC